MLRLAGALALVLILVAATPASPAAARHALARVKCVGLYCAIVSVPDPPSPRSRRSGARAREGFGGQARGRKADAAQVVAHPAGCPRVAFCGCGAALEVFGQPIRALWLAANWLRFPPAAPSPGMAAVRPHHVMIIRDYLGGGRALVYDANSGGHLTRVHVRSLRGYSIRNPRAR
jgi:hypothetical protein